MTELNNNLQMSVDEFKKLDLSKLKLYIDNDRYNDIDYIHFCIRCVLIIKELNEIPNFKKHLKGFYGDYIRDIKTNNDLKSYSNSGYKKILTCRLINCSHELLKKIPEKIFDIHIIKVPLYNKHIKLPFQLGTIKLDNNELCIIDKDNSINNGFISFFYNLFSAKSNVYNLIYSGDSDDIHSIEFTHDTIIYNVKESNKTLLNSHNIMKKEIQLPKHEFDYIIYKKIYV